MIIKTKKNSLEIVFESDYEKLLVRNSCLPASKRDERLWMNQNAIYVEEIKRIVAIELKKDKNCSRKIKMAKTIPSITQ